MRTQDQRGAGNLPQDLTSFVGREAELSEVGRCLTTARLLTLTGPAGIGKTRLALRAAAAAHRDFRDGVWLVELGALDDPALLPETVAAIFGLPEQTGTPALDMLTEYLRPRTALLMLDNCEHLVHACAELADRLLRECPRLRILATSREPINIAGEATLPISPLSLPDPERPPAADGLDRYEAVALFVTRATAVVSDFSLTAENYRTVVAICHHLDGLPLAIELAAPRLQVLSPDQMLDRLTDRFHLLTRGSRTAPSRQQTLFACIDWSFELCTAAERTLWARLAIFAGGFELDAVAAVCAGGEVPADSSWEIVSGLVDKSIVLREEHGGVVRYRLLESIRAYARQRLGDTGAGAELGRRHRDWVEQLVRRAETDLLGPKQVQWWARLDREQPNIRTALEFCLTETGEAEPGLRIVVALHAHWTRRRLTEGRQWIGRVLSRQEGPPTPTWMRAIYDAALLACFQSDIPAAGALAARAHEIAEQLGDERSRAFVTHTDANVALFSGNLPTAVDRYQEVLPLHRAANDLPRLLEALIALSLTSGLVGDGPTSVACHEEILAVTEPRGELRYRSYALYGLGVTRWRQGDAAKATELLQQSLRLKLLVDDPLSAAFCLDALAWAAAAGREFTRAAHLLGAAESLAQVALSPTEAVPDMRQFHEQCQQQTRDALGETQYQAAYRSGHELTFAEAVAYAVGDRASVTPEPPSAPEATLTKRERQVADLIADGLSNKEIAAQLAISLRTAEGHVEHILAKLRFATRAQVAGWVAGKSAPGPDA